MPVEFRIAHQLWAHARLRAQILRRRTDNQWGASAVEWAIISAIVVGLAVLIGAAITKVVQSKTGEIQGA